MGRDQRPLVTRHWMTSVLAVALALLLAGCGGNANVQGNSNNVSSSAAASFPGGRSLGTLFSIVFLAAVSHESDREMARSRAPEPDPSRRIVEHDCTRPIEDWSGNLKCR